MRRPGLDSISVTFVVTAILLLTGCSGNTGLQVDVLYDQSADFAAFSTYSWETGPRDDSATAAEIHARIKATAEAELSASGMRPSGPDEKPDLLLTYYGGIEDNLLLEGVRWEVSSRVVWSGASPLSETRSYQVGTLILDFADAATETIVWSGVVTGKAASSSQLRAQIEKAVKKALAEFPPG